MPDYFENKTHLSTSFLKKVLNPNLTFPKSDTLEFGQMVDTLLSEWQPLLIMNLSCTTPESMEVTEEALALSKVYVDNNKLLQTPKSRYQWEVYKTVIINETPTKCRGKLDHWIKGMFVEDFKTTRTAPTTRHGFDTLLNYFSYDMQAAMYLALTGEKQFWFSFLCRTKQTLTQFPISEKMLSNGRDKIQKAVKLWHEQSQS